MSKKMIQINPELLRMTKSRTRKANGSSNNNNNNIKPVIKPLITPNALKSKLLKRIKQHKTIELKQQQQQTITHTQDTDKDKDTENPHAESDEFHDALDYLSLQQQKQKQQQQKQKQQQQTMKHHHSPSSSLSLPIELNLPDDFAALTATSNSNPVVLDPIPYGCLKNGHKRTYRDWKRLTEPANQTDIIRPPSPPKKHNSNNSNNSNNSTPVSLSAIINANANANAKAAEEVMVRQQRLQQIKQKLRRIEHGEANATVLNELDQWSQSGGSSKTQTVDQFIQQGMTNEDIQSIVKHRQSQLVNVLGTKDDQSNPNQRKRYVKKTVKRRFTLGRSKALHRVSILLKDKQTRKQVIDAQKELRKTDMVDVKKYLRKHNMIKIGSTCPNDILRATFEQSVLSGEVHNTNDDILMHNFLSTEQEPLF